VTQSGRDSEDAGSEFDFRIALRNILMCHFGSVVQCPPVPNGKFGRG